MTTDVELDTLEVEGAHPAGDEPARARVPVPARARPGRGLRVAAQAGAARAARAGRRGARGRSTRSDAASSSPVLGDALRAGRRDREGDRLLRRGRAARAPAQRPPGGVRGVRPGRGPRSTRQARRRPGARGRDPRAGDGGASRSSSAVQAGYSFLPPEESFAALERIVPDGRGARRPRAHRQGPHAHRLRAACRPASPPEPPEVKRSLERVDGDRRADRRPVDPRDAAWRSSA